MAIEDVATAGEDALICTCGSGRDPCGRRAKLCRKYGLSCLESLSRTSTSQPVCCRVCGTVARLCRERYFGVCITLYLHGLFPVVSIGAQELPRSSQVPRQFLAFRITRWFRHALCFQLHLLSLCSNLCLRPALHPPVHTLPHCLLAQGISHEAVLLKARRRLVRG
jgi:hypothetical protein